MANPLLSLGLVSFSLRIYIHTSTHARTSDNKKHLTSRLLRFPQPLIRINVISYSLCNLHAASHDTEVKLRKLKKVTRTSHSQTTNTIHHEKCTQTNKSIPLKHISFSYINTELCRIPTEVIFYCYIQSKNFN